MPRYEFKVSPQKDPDLVAWLDSLYSLDGGFSLQLRVALKSYLSINGEYSGQGITSLPSPEVQPQIAPRLNNELNRTANDASLPEIIIDTAGMFDGNGSGAGGGNDKNELNQSSEEDLLKKLNSAF